MNIFEKAFSALMVMSSLAASQPRAIDPAKSVLTVHVSKAGLLSGLGHDHEIAAPIAAGTVDATSHQVSLHTTVRTMRVADTGISDKDRAEIQSNMLGPQVLDSAQYPEIAFQSTSASQSGEGAWVVKGNLTLHGQTHDVSVEVREKDGHFTGTSRFRQTEFGIKPIKVAGGAVQVKDEVRVEFDIQLTAR